MRILHAGWGFSPWRTGGLIAYAEDVMQAQAAGGHAVAYFCAGRHYPLLRRPRLREWSRSGVQIHEVLNSPIVVGVDMGTADPASELDEPHTERFFEEVLARFMPDVIHMEELFGLPSSLIDLAHRAEVPVVMTLQDYLPLCPTLKLYDTQERICLRRDPGAECARCCAAAPRDSTRLKKHTSAHHLVQLGRRLPRTRDAMWKVHGVATGLRPEAPATENRTLPTLVEAPPPAASAAAYQHRRDENVRRLGRADLLLAMSTRVASIYSDLGVDAGRLVALQLTVRHLALLQPRAFSRAPQTPRFATLNGVSSAQKGALVIQDAVRRLDAAGLGDAYVLEVHGLVEERFRAELDRFPAVRFQGPYETTELDGLLDVVDVGIVPSVWEEAYAYVGVEFLAKGIPVIGNALGGLTDYVKPGVTGWLNEEAGGAGLAELMSKVIRSPREIVDLNERIVERRDALIKPMDQHIDELETHYREVIERFGD